MRTVKEIRKLTGLSQGKFANKYGLPVRTLQGWESGRRSAPEYVIKLLERVVREDLQREGKEI